MKTFRENTEINALYKALEIDKYRDGLAFFVIDKYLYDKEYNFIKIRIPGLPKDWKADSFYYKHSYFKHSVYYDGSRIINTFGVLEDDIINIDYDNETITVNTIYQIIEPT